MLTFLACAAVLTAGEAQADLIHLGQPCRAKNVLAKCPVVDRRDGRERLVLTNMNEDTGCELIFVDFEKDTAEVFRAPAGSGSWALMEVPGDRLVVGTFYDGAFMIFDLKKMEFTNVTKFPGEGYIWNLALGGDGRVYGGTYPGGKLGALNLSTCEVEDCGAGAPPNLYCRNVSALPDGRIFCHYIQEKPVSLIYDPSSKTYSSPPDHLANAVSGVTWDECFIVGSQVFDRDLRPVNPPFPIPADDKGAWSVVPEMTTRDTLFIRQANRFYRFRKGGSALEFVGEVEPRFQGVSLCTKDGWLLGVRGQDYIVVKPGTKKAELRRIPAESGPRPTLFLRADPSGILWGGPHFGQTLFWLDPATGRFENTSTVCDAGGEVYDVAFLNGRVYCVAYAGGDIICYDPAKPWNQIDHVNPRVIASLGAKGYIRPIAGVQVGPDGRLYSGWMAKYGTYGGAVAITEPSTGETELIENPLGEQAVSGVVVGESVLYVGSSLAANGLPNKQGEYARFGIVDPATKRTVFQEEIEGAVNVRPLCYDPVTKRVAVSVNGKIRFFNTRTRKFLQSLPVDVPNLSCASVSFPGDGYLYYGSDRSVVALNMRTGRCRTLAQAPGKVANVAVGPSGTVYFSCGVDIYAIKGTMQWDLCSCSR
ncbi:MAG: hypothetical protein QHI38_04550 [Armatimonadota bacterium]|nr:hypothetical protein [Armatimonadota bacterium]